MKTEYIIGAVLLWLLWKRPAGVGRVSYVGYTDNGTPVALVNPAEPAMMPIGTELEWPPV